MDDATQTTQLKRPARHQPTNYRHLQTEKNSVREIPFPMEFAAESLKAQMLGGQAKTIALRGSCCADHQGWPL